MKHCLFPGLFLHFLNLNIQLIFPENTARLLPPELDGMEQGCADRMDLCTRKWTRKWPEMKGKSFDDVCQICYVCTTDMCNGDGADGTEGTEGTDATDATDGTSRIDGTDGNDGADGRGSTGFYENVDFSVLFANKAQYILALKLHQFI
jgi:hypothetical protein